MVEEQAWQLYLIVTAIMLVICGTIGFFYVRKILERTRNYSDELSRPGSAVSRHVGCTCDSELNNSGAGELDKGMVVFFVEPECSLHGYTTEWYAENQGEVFESPKVLLAAE